MKFTRIKKTIAMGLAAITATSALGISALAKETVQLDDGVVLEMYNPAVDEIENTPMLADVDFDFNLTIPVYPDFVFLASTSGEKNLVLDSDQSVIRITFDKSDRFRYFSVYDVTAGKYISGSSTSLQKVTATTSSVFKFSGLTGGHKYRIRLAHTTKQKSVTGSVVSY